MKPFQPTSLRTSPVAATLVQDTRGAILVLGLALGVLMTAALWSLIELGETVAFREAAQAAVDASAMENAIWHARGMNMIAALNICMALVVSVLVLWRLALAASTLGALVALIAALLEPNAVLAGRAASLDSLTRMLRADEALAAQVLAIVSELGAAQVAVAAYTPLMAAQAVTAQRIGNLETLPDTFSASSWRAAAAPASALALGADADGGRDGVPAPRLGGAVGLPVQADRHTLLCEQPEARAESADVALRDLVRSAQSGLLGTRAAGSQRALQALGLTGSTDLTAIVARLSGLADGLAPTVFCAPRNASLAELAGVVRDVPALGTLSDAQQAWRQLRHSWASGEAPVQGGAPAKVWAPAMNGSPLLRSAALLPEQHGMVAQAEMYFDCAESWARCAVDAAWQLRWTARLRRARALPVLLEQLAAQAGEGLRVDATLPPLERRSIDSTAAFEAATRRPESQAAVGERAEPISRALSVGAGLDSLIH